LASFVILSDMILLLKEAILCLYLTNICVDFLKFNNKESRALSQESKVTMIGPALSAQSVLGPQRMIAS
jgi:hypothetical protein